MKSINDIGEVEDTRKVKKIKDTNLNTQAFKYLNIQTLKDGHTDLPILLFQLRKSNIN